MSTTVNITTLNGNFKKVYADKMDKLIPMDIKISPEIDFIPSEKMGGLNYNVPVAVANEHGVTYGGEEGEAFNLLPPVSGNIKEASVKGSEIVMRSFISYGAASRAEKSQAAFVRTTKYIVENLTESINRKLEAECLYGQMGLSTVASVAGAVVTMTSAEFAPGIWFGAKGMRLEFYDASGATLRGEAQVEKVDLDNKALTLNAMPAGVVATDVIFEKSAKGKEFVGIHKVLSNTGTLFGISANTYEVWKSTVFGVGGNLSFGKITEGLGKAAGRGLNVDIKLYVSNATWAKMVQDQAAYRQYDTSYKSEKAENGFRSIMFHSQNGSVEIIPHTYVKEGYAFGLVLEDWEKVGSTDVTFKIPGSGGEEFFRPLSDAAGFELRCYADWAIFCHKPNRQILYTGITNS